MKWVKRIVYSAVIIIGGVAVISVLFGGQIGSSGGNWQLIFDNACSWLLGLVGVPSFRPFGV